MLHIALLYNSVAAEIEETYIKPNFTIDKSEKLDTLDDVFLDKTMSLMLSG